MRITGGECRGRVIWAPEGLEVRPTASKIRQAFFNIVSNIVRECRFVDVCAGTGLMGIEALSRGAATLIAIDESRPQVQAINANLKKLGLADRAEVILSDAYKGLKVLHEAEADIIYIDPPYRTQLSDKLLLGVDSLNLLAPEGVLAIEHGVATRLPDETEHLIQYDRRKYGQTVVSFFKRR